MMLSQTLLQTQKKVSKTITQYKYLELTDTMQSPQVKTLYTLKTTANQHLKNKQFGHAQVYFVDIIGKMSGALEKLESEDEMEKFIKEIKLPSHKNLALCCLKLGENQKCVEQCREVLEVEPNCLKTLYRISRALMAQKDYDEAEKYLKRGFAIDPMEQEILKALEQVETARNPPPKNQDSLLSLKKILALVLYFPLLILNWFLTKIFGKPLTSQAKQRVD